MWFFSGASYRPTQIPLPLMGQEATSTWKPMRPWLHEMGLTGTVNETARDSLCHANTDTRTHTAQGHPKSGSHLKQPLQEEMSPLDCGKQAGHLPVRILWGPPLMGLSLVNPLCEQCAPFTGPGSVEKAGCQGQSSPGLAIRKAGLHGMTPSVLVLFLQ